MNDTPLLDDLERTIVHTLSTKADQLTVEPGTFDPEAAVPVPLVRRSPERRLVTTGAGRGRRILAVAAAVAVLAGAAGVLGVLDSDGPEETVAAASEIMWAPPAHDGVPAAVLPGVPPEGWTFAGVATNANVSLEDTTWQLFAVDGPAPLAQAVLVGSERWDDAVGERALPGEPTVTVQGQEAFLGTWTDPNGPAGAPHLAWRNGDIYHDAVAVGLSEAELLAFAETLQPRAEATAGFDTTTGTPLPELQATTYGDDLDRLASAFYDGPDGQTLAVSARTFSHFGGGLLERMLGTAHGDGYLRHGTLTGGGTYVAASRADGWVVDVTSFDGGVDPALLEAFVDSLRPYDYQQVVDLALGLPVHTTGTVGDWSVEVHGGEGATQALCLSHAGEHRACGLALGTPPFTVGSVLLDGQWVLVALRGSEQSATIRTASPGPDADPGFEPEVLEGERAESDDQVIEIVVMPEDAAAVAVTGQDEDGTPRSYGFDYRPTD